MQLRQSRNDIYVSYNCMFAVAGRKEATAAQYQLSILPVAYLTVNAVGLQHHYFRPFSILYTRSNLLEVVSWLRGNDKLNRDDTEDVLCMRSVHILDSIFTQF